MSLPAASGQFSSSDDFSTVNINYEEKPNIKLNRGLLGFTLIELLVVISIIVLLIGAATFSWTDAQKKGRDGKRKADLKSIQQALESFHQSTGHYPPWSSADPLNENTTWCTYISNTGYTQVKSALEPTYIQKLPQDPAYVGVPKDYWYEKIGAGQYKLVAILENTNDPERATYTKSAFCTGSGYNQTDYNNTSYIVTQP